MSNLEPEDLIDHIKNAFARQPIPDRPVEIEFMTLSATETKTEKQIAVTTFFTADRIGQFVATISVVIVCVVLARSFWQPDDTTTSKQFPPIELDPRESLGTPPETDQPKPVIAEVTPNQIEPVAKDQLESVTPDVSDEHNQRPIVNTTPSKLLRAITVMNRCLLLFSGGLRRVACKRERMTRKGWPWRSAAILNNAQQRSSPPLQRWECPAESRLSRMVSARTGVGFVLKPTSHSRITQTFSC